MHAISGQKILTKELSMTSDEAHRRAEALFKKEQQLREGQQAMAECQAELGGCGRFGWLAPPPIRRHRPPIGRALGSTAKRAVTLVLLSGIRCQFDRLDNRGI